MGGGDTYNEGRTLKHRYECMGATTLIIRHADKNMPLRILDAGCSRGTATITCKSFLEKSGYDVSMAAVDRDKKRWRIENNFKSVEQNRARTGSRNHAIRVFMFFLSMTVCNLWYTAVRKINNMMETKRRRRVKINITANVFLALLIALVKKIITSVNKELEYYLQWVR